MSESLGKLQRWSEAEKYRKAAYQFSYLQDGTRPPVNSCCL